MNISVTNLNSETAKLKNSNKYKNGKAVLKRAEK